MPSWLRWTLVLPVAVVSFVVIQFFVAFSSEQMPLPGVLRDWYSQALNSIAAPWAFVFLGAQTAPNGRALPTAISLAVAFSVFTGAVMALAFMVGSFSQPLWWLLVSAVMGVVTVVATCVQIYKEAQPDPLKKIEGRELIDRPATDSL
jgi:hypothetical protein